MMRPLVLVLLILVTLAHAPLTHAAEPAMPPSDIPPRLTLQQLRQQYASPADKMTTIDGVEVVYRDEGRGPAILLIHGSNSTLRTYDDVVARLRDRYRLIRYDVPPNGLSGPIPDKVIGRLRASDIPAQILKALGVTRVTAAGVSSGGTTALYFAAEHPEMVERVIAASTPSDPVDMSTLKRTPALEQAESTYGSYLDSSRAKPRHFWRTYVEFYTGVPGRFSDKTVDEMYDFGRRTPEPNSTALVGVVADQDRLNAALAKVNAPVLLLWGGANPLLPPPAAVKALERRLTAAQVSTLVMPDVSHYVPIEVPDRYAEVLHTYITAVTPAASSAPKR
jgi:pimeloyl-ACP methyl ester carboxylesterase